MKKGKSKKNWFKVQFEKHPYIYSALIGWPILYYILLIIDDNSKVDAEVLLIILLSFPIIIFFLWFRKNKSKVKSFYKRNNKIFNRVYFYLGSVFSLIPIACIVGIIATGSVSNFIERAKFEINAAVLTYSEYDYCQSPDLIAYSGYPKDNRIYFFKEQTQYIDYFENELPGLILRDLDLFNVNHCIGTRYLLKEAQNGSELAKEILVAYPPELRNWYSFPWDTENNKYIFSRYEKNIANMDLDNPAIAYSYAVYLDKNLDEVWWSMDEIKSPIKPEALKYLKQSAEDGYLLAMSTLTLSSLSKNYAHINCDNFMKYIYALSEKNSLIAYHNLMNAYMGKLSTDMNKHIYKCLNQSPNFSKAFLMLSDMPFNGSSRSTVKKSNNLKSSVPAIFYLYGLGDVEQNYDKAYELFSYSDDKINNEGIPDHAYLAYMNYMGMGVQQNQNKGKGLTIELIKTNILYSLKTDKSGLLQSCTNFDNYENFRREIRKANKLDNEISEKYIDNDRYVPDEEINKNLMIFLSDIRNTLGQCLLNSDHEVSIKFLEGYIYNRVSEWFQNPELVKNLNYLGKPN